MRLSLRWCVLAAWVWILVPAAVTGLQAITTEVASIRSFLYGTEPACAYDNWISHVSEGSVSSLNVYAPYDQQNNDFGEYLIPPDSLLTQWEAVILRWLSADLSGAESLIQQYQFPYEVVMFQDTDSGRLFYMLRENLNDDVDPNYSPDAYDDELGSFDYGWGLYIYNPAASRPIIISVPHPCDDYPSPVMGLEALLKLDARFLMIAGAGREVAYFPPYNSNNASISDPSRFEEHPFNVAYQRAADQIRALTGKMEFSLQVHTYDWDKYGNDSSVMLSAGNNRNYCALPIRDASRAQNDLIHHTPYVVFPQGQVDNAADITINQYYCVYYSSADPVRYIKDAHNVLIPYNRNLPGALENRQMLYTEPQNTYDVFSPFLHVEMDELPRFWNQTNANLNWFYGWNNELETWDISQRWNRFIPFYMPWIDALDTSLDAMLALDDNTGPSNPENLRVTELWNIYTVEVAWDRSYSYDFDTYELRLRYFDGSAFITEIYDRTNVPKLAWQLLNKYELSFPDEPAMIYLSILARDKHGNSSIVTPEIKIYKPLYYYNGLDSFTATPLDGAVRLDFEGAFSGTLGFNVNRCSTTEPWTRVASWTTHPELHINASETYHYTDTGLTNGTVYRYQISADYQSQPEFFDWQVLTAQPQRILALTVTNTTSGLTDSLLISMNIMAQDGYDPLDRIRTISGSPPLVLVVWDSEDEVYLSKDIKATFDPLQVCKMWSMRCFTYIWGQTIRFSVDPAMLEPGWDFLLHDKYSGAWHDLRAGPYYWESIGSQWRQFELCWGYNPPRVVIPEGPDIYQLASVPLNFQWQVVNPARVSHLTLKIVCSADSMVIADILPAAVEYYSYVPPTQGLIGARLVVESFALDGSVFRAVSSWKADLVPDLMTFQAPAGFSCLSLPLPNFSQPLTQLLGSGVLAWQSAAQNLWQPVSVINSSTAFLIHSPTPYQLSFPATLNPDPPAQQIVPGWNLLSNPQYRALPLAALYFNSGSQTFSYADLMQTQQLTSKVLTFSSSGWIDTSEVPPMHAFMLYYGGSTPLQMSLGTPSASGVPQPEDIRWSALLSVSDGFGSGDAIRMGIADSATQAVDADYDLDKPPLFPLANIRLALRQPNGAGGYRDLQSEYRELYPDHDPVQKQWQLRLDIPLQRPLAFTCTSFGMPAHYSITVQIGDSYLQIPAGQTRWWDPPSTGSFYGTVTISSYTASGFQPYQATPAKNIAWPNPFGNSVNLDLKAQLGREVDVAVYNIRGQKLVHLYTGTVLPGRSTLTWDGRDRDGQRCAPGIYFIRILSDHEILNYKVLRSEH